MATSLAGSRDRPILESLTLDAHKITPCLLCESCFTLDEDKDKLLSHLAKEHKLIIGDVHLISSLRRYLLYWKKRFQDQPLTDFCCAIQSNGEKDNEAVEEEYYLLCDVLPEDKDLRRFLQMQTLEVVLAQKEKERLEDDISRPCLFCKDVFMGSRTELLNHMATDHSFNPGHPDNLVYVDEFLDELRKLISKLQCLYCEKIFTTLDALKNHMRKKLHRKISPKAKKYDRFYVVNYLEFGKSWEATKSVEIAEQKHHTDSAEDSEDESYLECGEEESTGAVCLFCSFTSSHASSLHTHMKDTHQFDLPGLQQSLGLTFYRQVKLVNFIRRQLHLGQCYVCGTVLDCKDAVQAHMQTSGHCGQLPDKKEWDKQWYYFPTYEDDHLLGMLEDADKDTEDEDKEVEVYGEDEPEVAPDSILSRPSAQMLRELECRNLTLLRQWGSSSPDRSQASLASATP